MDKIVYLISTSALCDLEGNLHPAFCPPSFTEELFSSKCSLSVAAYDVSWPPVGVLHMRDSMDKSVSVINTSTLSELAVNIHPVIFSSSVAEDLPSGDLSLVVVAPVFSSFMLNVRLWK